ncbi:DUF3124 domain-containing protein [Muriicola marianensis]|uniref:DUF3124 domain-containing protein n=1 Tax=Muriicola marianensis TaxID=1324801 RepID=A0ABQ1QWP0_9FLAO|nr:DUF3124 domain-containing protein [Muriicola marianensis]GGD45997.1 hypothetical protein GCM10011361_11210 [Muriicola marianensis]
MKYAVYIMLILLSLASCQEQKEYSSVDPVNWGKRTIELPKDSLVTGSTYLSVYSQIYSQTEHVTHDLTATVSMRNINRQDTVYLTNAEYFDTHGNLIRTYFKNVIYIAPMETIEIVIDENDREGGTGANFIFDWAIAPGVAEPHFEAVMISTSGQQGLSFATSGQRIE